jgi:hypothetical protein
VAHDCRRGANRHQPRVSDGDGHFLRSFPGHQGLTQNDEPFAQPDSQCVTIYCACGSPPLLRFNLEVTLMLFYQNVLRKAVHDVLLTGDTAVEGLDN